MKRNILTVDNLHVSFKTQTGKITAVRGVNFELKKSKTLEIVGKSGSRK